MTEAGVFDSEYARFYDLMYHDKPYAEEAAWAASMLRRLNPKAVSLLELGCGTLNHAPHLAEAGFEIACVDSSSAMMEQAKVRLSSLPPRLAERIGLHREDILTLDLGLTFDAACSLFHVFDYFTENDSLASAFSAVSRHLVPGGAFLFDFWFGPAVLRDLPQVRVKRIENEEVEIFRIAEPRHDVLEDTVRMKNTLLIKDKTSGVLKECVEEHKVRYFFLPELHLLLERAGLKIKGAWAWMTDSSPHEGAWFAAVAAMKT